MRTVTKGPVPPVLEANATTWTAEFIANKTSAALRYRYRHPEIKAALVAETYGKCVYCESKIGHNTPGDVEHKVPSSVDESKHFDWSNLTISCAECNRRKNNYFDTIKPFLDPYIHNVEDLLVHAGPIVCWKAGVAEAEVTVKILDLSSGARFHLIGRKIEKIEEMNTLIERLNEVTGTFLEPLIKLEIERKASPASEYSGMVKSYLNQAVGF